MSSQRVFAFVSVIAVLVIAGVPGNRVYAGPLVATDVSPSRPFGSPESGYSPFGSDPSGRVITVVVDPTNAAILYAASQNTGVWKSTDGAHTWRQSSNGLLNGISATGNSQAVVLAMDRLTPQRLIYATADDDLRPGTPSGGLWVSRDSAGSWTHVTLPGCDPAPSIGNVAFGTVLSGPNPLSTAWVTTRCGIAVALDLDAWWFPSPSFLTGDGNARVAAFNDTTFACKGTGVHRSTDHGSSWTTGPTLPGNCYELSAIDSNAVVAIHFGSDVDVSVIDFSSSPPGLQSLGWHHAAECCGVLGVHTPRRRSAAPHQGPGVSYDVFASSGFQFYQYQPATPTTSATWVVIDQMHVDTFSMAFPSAYDPDNGDCTAYAANDGGIFANTHSSGDACVTAEGPWVRAEDGLSIMASYTMAGISHPSDPSCDDSQMGSGDCRALYLPTGDDGTWVTRGGRLGDDSWDQMGCCGDSGSAFVDPALPGQVITARNGIYSLYRSADGRPPVRSDSKGNIAPLFAFDGIAPPGQSGLSQVMTLASEGPAPLGDYVAVVSPRRYIDEFGGDVLVRNRDADAGKWEAISAGFFGPKQVGAIATSGGHSSLTIYALTSNDEPAGGRIYKGRIDASGRVSAWETTLSSDPATSIQRAYNLFANPYDPRNVYVTDLGAGQIKSSTNGGTTWQAEPELTRIATRDGEFRFECGPPANPFGPGSFSNLCPLTAMLFVRDQPEIRVAVLFPGGAAFSRDAGMHWISLAGMTVPPLERPYSGFYDPSPPIPGDVQSLYVAQHGHGVVRIDASFRTLAVVKYVFCPECACRSCFPPGLLPSQVSVWDRGFPQQAHQVAVINDVTNAMTLLRQGPDGLYRGEELLDSAQLQMLSYHFLVDGQSSIEFFYMLSDDDRSSGVVSVSVPGNIPTATPTPVPTPPPPSCMLDVDASGPPANVGTDIVYIARRLLGLSPVPSSFRQLGPAIPSDETVSANIDRAARALDVDSDGVVSVATDIVYIARRLLGLTPAPTSFRVLTPAIVPDAQIAVNTDARCP